MPFSSQWFSNPSTGDYTIDNSCSFDATNDYLYKDFGSSAGGTTTKWTFSCWVKRSKLDSSGTNQGLLSAGTSGNNRGGIFFVADDLYVAFNIGGTWHELRSNEKYRDTSAWMHVCVKFDTTQETATNRTNIYVNGSEVSYESTADSCYVGEDVDTGPISASSTEQVIGAYSANKAANVRP